MTATKSKSIVFTADEVRAVLAGKREFRRDVKPQPEQSRHFAGRWLRQRGVNRWDLNERCRSTENLKTGEFTVEKYQLPVAEWLMEFCPFVVGDRVWVKEPWQAWAEFDGARTSILTNNCASPYGTRINYLADGNVWDAKRRSAITMPQWASRLTLLISSIKVEQNEGTWQWCAQFEVEASK